MKTKVLKQIIKQEWRNLHAERTIYVAALLFALAFAYGVFNGIQFVRGERKVIETKIAETVKRHNDFKTDAARYEAELKDAGKTPKMLFGSSAAIFAGNLGVDVVLPVESFAAFSVGQADLQLPYTKISTFRGRQNLFDEAENENPLALLDRRFDLSFVVVFLYPLLILVVCYNLLSAERENGTLALTLSQPVSLKTLLLGKITIRAALVIGFVIFLGIVGAIVNGAIFGFEDVLWKLALWISIVAAYGCFWFAFAAFVNALGRGSATNAMLLVAAWLAFVVVIPSLINLLAASLYPIPSRLEYVQAIRAATNEIEQTDGKTRLVNFYRENPQFLPEGKTADTVIAASTPQFVGTYGNNTLLSELVENRVEPTLSRFDEQTQKQRRLISFLSFASPAVLTQDALDELAGTSAFRYENFRRAASDYGSQWR